MEDRRWWELPRVAQVAIVVVLALVAVGLAGLAVRRSSTPVLHAGSVPAAAPTTAPSPTPSATPPPPPPGPVGVAFIGDGAVARPLPGAAPDWTALTAQALQASGTPVAAAVGASDGAGYVARSAAGRVFSELVATTVTPATRVVVLLGSRNDLADTAEVGDAARVTFEAVHQVAPAAAVLVVAPVPVRGDATASLSGDRDALRYAAGAVGATFVDPLAEGWSLPAGTTTTSRSRGVRLTAAGHAYIADHLVPHLRPLLASAGARPSP